MIVYLCTNFELVWLSCSWVIQETIQLQQTFERFCPSLYALNPTIVSNMNCLEGGCCLQVMRGDQLQVQLRAQQWQLLHFLRIQVGPGEQTLARHCPRVFGNIRPLFLKIWLTMGSRIFHLVEHGLAGKTFPILSASVIALSAPDTAHAAITDEPEKVHSRSRHGTHHHDHHNHHHHYRRSRRNGIINQGSTNHTRNHNSANWCAKHVEPNLNLNLHQLREAIYPKAMGCTSCLANCLTIFCLQHWGLHWGFHLWLVQVAMCQRGQATQKRRRVCAMGIDVNQVIERTTVKVFKAIWVGGSHWSMVVKWGMGIWWMHLVGGDSRMRWWWVGGSIRCGGCERLNLGLCFIFGLLLFFKNLFFCNMSEEWKKWFFFCYLGQQRSVINVCLFIYIWYKMQASC